MLLGPNRGRYFLLTGQRLYAEEALRLGVVNEVLASDEVLPRARVLAGQLRGSPTPCCGTPATCSPSQSDSAVFDGLSHGLAVEGLGAFESWPQEER